MFKPHYGACSACPRTEVMIPVKSGMCVYCNYEKKQKSKKAAGKKTSTYKYTREATGEGEMFREIALNTVGDEATTCFVCGIRIAVVTHHNMAHILAKGKYPAFRLNPDNIKILCYNYQGTGCHSKLDARPRSEIINDPKWQKLFELEAELKEEYKNLTNL